MAKVDLDVYSNLPGVSRSSTGHYLYTLGAVSMITTRSPDFIRKLHREGYFPEPLLNSRLWKIYTENQIKLMLELFPLLSERPRKDRLTAVFRGIARKWGKDYEKKYPDEVKALRKRKRRKTGGVSHTRMVGKRRRERRSKRRE